MIDPFRCFTGSILLNNMLDVGQQFRTQRFWDARQAALRRVDRWSDNPTIQVDEHHVVENFSLLHGGFQNTSGANAHEVRKWRLQILDE